MTIFWVCFLLPILGAFSSPPLQLDPFSGALPFATDDSAQIRQSSPVRLPQNVQPKHYNLTIQPIIHLPLDDPQQFTAPGTVVITVICSAATNSITLHANEIDINHGSVTVTSAAGDVEVTGHSNDSSVSQYTIELGSSLTVGTEYVIKIEFVAQVGDRLSGLYRSSYIGEDRNPRWLATTQFQKLGARMAFPCFDEPAMKATFSIKVRRTNAYIALTNGQFMRTSPTPITGIFEDEFETTVVMSTYLIAIVVSDFKDITAPQELSDYIVKTWGPPPMTDLKTGNFSSVAAAKILKFFEDYLDYKYQFGKLDSVAVPDFSAGAMENWALNTYRVNLMLWFEGESTQFEQWRQSYIIAHEISHHWFGDLVTCDWWNDLWLNEGFANYMQFFGSTGSEVGYEEHDRYILDGLQLALDFDATSASVPVHSSDFDIVVNQPSRIIYEKAGALIRMMQSFLTEPTFQKALQVYLKKYQYSTAVQQNLFDEFQAQALVDNTAPEYSVTEIMNSWTLTTGFPLIRVSTAGGNRIYVSQERFTQPDVDPPVNDELYYVPISIATDANPDFTETNWKPKFWMDKFTILQSYNLEGENSGNEWVIVNPDARYYYRVLYDSHFFELIKTQLVATDHLKIGKLSRTQLIDDYFKSSAFKYVNIRDALDLTRYLEKEIENTVWTTVFNNLRPITRMLVDQDASSALKTYLLARIEAVLTRIGWTQQAGDVPAKIFLRAQLLDWACSFDSEECKTLAQGLASQWASDPENNRIIADYQAVVFCKAINAAEGVTGDIRQLVLDEYKKATRAERLTLFSNALACESDSAKVTELMNMTIDSASGIARAYGITMLQRLGENPAHRVAVLEFLTDKTSDIIDKLGESALSSVVSSIAAYTTSADAINKIQGTVETLKQFPGLSAGTIRALESSVNQLSTNSAWISYYYADIASWLSNNV